MAFHIFSSVLFRVLWHVTFQTKHAGRQLGRWLVATYQLPHRDYEDKMAFHIVSSVLFRVLWHVKIQTEHAGRQLGRWLVATYQLPHWYYENRMALHIIDLYCLVCSKRRCIRDIRFFLHIFACSLFRVLWWVKFQTKLAGHQLGRWLVATYQPPPRNSEDRLARHICLWSNVMDLTWFSRAQPFGCNNYISIIPHSQNTSPPGCLKHECNCDATIFLAA
jgi:hypothetical protein